MPLSNSSSASAKLATNLTMVPIDQSEIWSKIYIAWYNQRIPYAQWMMGTRNSCRVTKSLYTFFSTQRSQLSNSYSHTDTLMPLTSFFWQKHVPYQTYSLETLFIAIVGRVSFLSFLPLQQAICQGETRKFSSRAHRAFYFLFQGGICNLKLVQGSQSLVRHDHSLPPIQLQPMPRGHTYRRELSGLTLFFTVYFRLQTGLFATFTHLTLYFQIGYLQSNLIFIKGHFEREINLS